MKINNYKLVFSNLFILFTLSLKTLGVEAQPRQKDERPLYLNKDAPTNDRVNDLLKRMTLQEKIAQMCQYVGIEHIKAAEKTLSLKQLKNNDAASFYPGLSINGLRTMVSSGLVGSFLHVVTAKEANELQRLAQQSRLKIPLLIGIDAIHGNGLVTGSTIYPSPIGLSCTWDTALVKQVARFTAVEMRATGSHWAFSPNLDIARDARWGRVGETFGEDPFLVSSFGVAMIKGLQGDDLTGDDKVIACAKHLIAGSVPINGLNKAPTDISERTLKEIYLPPFKAAIDAGVYSIMPAHNEVNGVPCHANAYLMDRTLRKEWGFKGFYISDFMDIERLAEVHHTALDQTDAVQQTVAAGMDMHMHGPNFMGSLLKLVKSGKVSEQRIDSSVCRILEAKFRSGLFENPFVDSVSNKVYTPQHVSASLDAARKSIVLLKNDDLLPIDPRRYKRILVTGPNAAGQAILGDWTMQQPEKNIITVLNGIRQEAGTLAQVDFFDCGSDILKMDSRKLQQAVVSAKNADLIVIVVGDNSLRSGKDRTAGENVDRDDLDLPGLQEKLIEAIVKTGKPVVVVLVNGRPLSIPWVDKNVPAVLEAWEPGCQGGKAVAEILFGKTDPSGKLTVSIPRNVGQIGNFYDHKPSQFIREYLGSETGPLYEFGHGLSYTSFKYGVPELTRANIRAGEQTEISIDITNKGARSGDEIVQLYLRGSVGSVTKPVKELKGFKRISLSPGETRKVKFTITPQMLSNYKIDNSFGIEPGEFQLMIGPSSADKDLQHTSLQVRAN